MGKHFLLNPNLEHQDKDVVLSLEKDGQQRYDSHFTSRKDRDISALTESDNLRHVEGKVIVKIDMDSKDSWTFENGTKIEYKRRFNNFNTRETQPVNAIVISGENIPKDSEILIHPNAIHDSNRIFDYKDKSDNIRYYSIHNDMCFAWHDGEDWKPLEPFAFALNVFEPYKGLIQGLPPTQLKDTLYVLDGELKGKVVKTLVACSYTIVFQGRSGREENIIRFRPFGEPKAKREEEAIAILNYETKKVLSGELLIGITEKDAVTIQEKFTNVRP